MPLIRERLLTPLCCLLVCGFALLTLETEPAGASFGVMGFDGQLTAGPAPNPSPNPDNPADPANFAPNYAQAGGHPYALTTKIRFNRGSDPVYGEFWPDEPVRDIIVETPAGLIGNPTAVGHCHIDELIGNEKGPLCPAESQVGYIFISFPPACSGDCVLSFRGAPAVYAMEAPPNAPARFAFNAAGTTVVLDASVRTGGDYGVTVSSRLIGEGLPIVGTTLVLWGTPADPSHDFQRACPGEPPPPGLNLGGIGPSCSAGVEPKPFLTVPTACNGPLTTTLRTDSWFDPDRFVSASFLSHRSPGIPDPILGGVEEPAPPTDQWGAPYGLSGCEQIPFDPQLEAKPETPASPGPSGWTFDLTMPQVSFDDPIGIAEGHLKKAVVSLPRGVRVSPSSAGGLDACTPAQIALGSAAEPSCPEASKIGNVRIETPLLEDPLAGSVYLATPRENPLGSLLATYIVARGSGVMVKLPGGIESDPGTGLLTASFDDLPQQPFTHMHLELFGGQRAVLSNPPRCGTYTTQAVLTSRSGKTVTSDSSFTTSHDGKGAPCPPPRFGPHLAAGSENPLAGAFSPFVLRLNRDDEDEELAGLTFSPPAGLLASLRGTSYCPDAALAAADSSLTGAHSGAQEQASPSCPASSQLGTVLAAAGPGLFPFPATGKLYLAGPYRGAPLSLAAIVPALAGPFDLGSVVVRNAIQIDPSTAQLKVVSDPLPSILEGIPLQIREIRVNVDRPNFTLNPTSCDPMSIEADISSVEGSVAHRSERFQVANCADLDFAPKLQLQLRGATGRGGHPALRSTLTMPDSVASSPRCKRRKDDSRARFCDRVFRPAKDANIARAAVTLPKSEILDQAHIGTVCTRVQYSAHVCPAGSVYGHARAFTPLLDRPLEGPVYLRSSSHKLPDLVASLDGQIQVDLVGRIDSFRGRIRNTFEMVPDAPVSKFVLTMRGGTKGLLVNTTDICARAHRATVKLDGQNGKIHDIAPALRPGCAKSKRGKGRHHHRGA